MIPCAPTDLKVSGTGFWNRASFGSGEEERMEPGRLSFSALGIQAWARHICGKLPRSFKELNITDGEK